MTLRINSEAPDFTAANGRPASCSSWPLSTHCGHSLATAAMPAHAPKRAARAARCFGALLPTYADVRGGTEVRPDQPLSSS